MIRKTGLRFPEDKLDVAVNRFNAHISVAERLLPVVVDILDGSKTTKDHVGKRDMNKIWDAIKDHNELTKSWLNISLDTIYSYTVYLKFVFSSPAKFGVNYIERNYIVAERSGNESEVWSKPENPIEMPSCITTEMVMDRFREIKIREAQMEHIEQYINSLRREIHSFLDK